MNNFRKVNDLHNLLKQYFGDEVKLLHYDTKPLTSKGENYGSEMIDLQMEILHEGNVRSLKLVAKMCPNNDALKEVFDTALTFKKEINTYNLILPTLLKFQEETCGRRCETLYAECFGTRFNLNLNMDTIDDDAVILLENLKLSQFSVKDRFKGFTLEETELILEKLATFHAVPVAFKIKRPQIFSQRILPHLNRNTIFDTIDEETEAVHLDFIVQAALTNEDCTSYTDNVLKAMKLGLENHKKTTVKEPFATICHNDFWVNNIMLKSDATDCKIIDFQLIDYGSPANDLLFFLFTSVQEDVLNSNLNYLITCYYDAFLRNLKEMNCDIKQFGFNSFMEEVEFWAKNKQFYHIISMLRIIFAVKENVKDLSEITMEDLSCIDDLSPECNRKIISTILHFANNNWI